MSTEYYTEPNIPWERLLASTSVDVSIPTEVWYTVPARLIHKDGSYVYAFLRDGQTRFERFGINRVENVFPPLIQEFGVEFIDEYGLPWDLE